MVNIVTRCAFTYIKFKLDLIVFDAWKQIQGLYGLKKYFLFFTFNYKNILFLLCFQKFILETENNKEFFSLFPVYKFEFKKKTRWQFCN